MPDSIEVSDEAGIRVIRMNRPEKKNALTQPMYAAMTRALADAQDDDAIRCLVIAGGPGAFCAGADIAEFLELAQSGALRPNTIEFLKAIAHNRKPVVAAVKGLAVGIGVTMLFHCDHVVASADATFTTPFLKLALIPEAASSLPRRCAWACARLRHAGDGPYALRRRGERSRPRQQRSREPLPSTMRRCRRRARSRRFRPARWRCRGR